MLIQKNTFDSNICREIIKIPDFFFKTIHPPEIRQALKAAMQSEEAVEAVGDDLEDIANYVRDTHVNEEVRNAAGRLFPRPGEPGERQQRPSIIS